MIGRLRQRVTLQRPVLNADSSGGASSSWVDVQSLFADITPLSGGEKAQAERLVNAVSHRVVVRAGLAVAAGQRLVWRGQVLRIQAVLNIAARDRLLALLCVEGEDA